MRFRNGDSVSGIRAVEKRGVYQVSLPEMCKGKVEIGEYGFLFQSVSTPAVVVQHKKEDESISSFDDDDVIFLSLLGFFSLVAGGLMWWISMQPRPEPVGSRRG